VAAQLSAKKRSVPISIRKLRPAAPFPRTVIAKPTLAQTGYYPMNYDPAMMTGMTPGVPIIRYLHSLV